MAKKTINDLKEKKEDLFNQYWRYSSYLKNWFIGYGIGALILFVNNQPFFSKMPSFYRYFTFISMFLAIFSQVLVTIINKYDQYCLYLVKSEYMSDGDSKFQSAFKRSEYYWMDRSADWITMVLYLTGTIIIFVFI